MARAAGAGARADRDDWLHGEAEVLAGLIAATGVERPLLVGHSDGASIALIYAADGGQPVAGVVAMAPHTFVEDVCVDAIAEMRSDPAGLVESLGDHHDRPRELFEAWSAVWVSEVFRRWDVRPRLGAITAPTLMVQGDGDEFGSVDMLWETVTAIGPMGQGQMVAGTGHLLHHDAPDLMAEMVARWERVCSDPHGSSQQ